MNINEIVMDMTPQEKEIYFKHQEKRHKEEKEKIEFEKENLKGYKESLIMDILKKNPNWTVEQLRKKNHQSVGNVNIKYFYFLWRL